MTPTGLLPEDREHLRREAHAILALAPALTALCRTIGVQVGLHETEVAQLAEEMLSRRLTVEDAATALKE